MTFSDFWPNYIKQKMVVAKSTTICAYTLCWRSHLRSYFGDVEIEDIKNSFIQNYINEGLQEGRNTKCIRDEITLLKNIIKSYAIFTDKPYYSPIVIWPSRAKVGEIKKREKYDSVDFERLVSFCKDSPKHWHKAIALACMTGMRIGEVCGIRFSDFDFERHIVRVQRTVGREYWGAGHSELYVNTTKTICSNRVIPIPEWLCLYYMNYQKLYGLSDDAYITPGEKSPFIEPRTMRSKFARLCKEIGVEYKTFHSLRHTYASRLLMSNVDVRTAAELLGHSDVAMTLNVYAHSDDSAKFDAAKKIFL